MESADSRRLSGEQRATRARRTRAWPVMILALLAMAAVPGCTRNPRVVPVSGVVMYNDKPLPFGTVLFQPDKGQMAVGEIQGDGTFQLSSYGPNDGAVPGSHRVSVNCYEGQRPGTKQPEGGEVSMGKLLIPLKYTRLGTSGLSANVADAPTENIEIKLEGPPVSF